MRKPGLFFLLLRVFVRKPYPNAGIVKKVWLPVIRRAKETIPKSEIREKGMAASHLTGVRSHNRFNKHR